MTPIASFAATIASWQNFYLLVGTSAATLIGLMFVAITFGASLVTPETAASARAFLDPTFTHFVHVLVTACLITIPSMGTKTLGALLLVIGVVRAVNLFGVYRSMQAAHRTHNDVELSDWVSGVVIPLLAYLLLLASGGAFLAGYSAAFDALAIVVVSILLVGVFGAWELMMWMAVTRAQRK